MTLRLLTLPRYGPLGASSRVRTLQYLDFFSDLGWTVSVAPLLTDDYLRSLYQGRKRSTLAAAQIVKRLIHLRGMYAGQDRIFLEKELLPWLPFALERALLPNQPFLLDIDDAIFHNYDMNRRAAVRSLLGDKVDRVMCRAAVVTAGSEYLADRARKAGARTVALIPTSVDLRKYHVLRVEKSRTHPVVIGWIGSPMTQHYLRQLAPVLRELTAQGVAKFIAIGASNEVRNWLDAQIEPWSEETEVALLQSIDVGVMPLPDLPWERGKCGYKLIQFMACGKPVVASPIGANRQIVQHGLNGYLATTESEWWTSLRDLVHDAAMRKLMGDAGRRSVELRYSVQVNGPRLAKAISDLTAPGY